MLKIWEKAKSKTNIRRSTKIVDIKDKCKDMNTFHASMRSILTAAQCFGMLPVGNVRDPEPHRLRFTLRSVLAMYSCLLIAAVFVIEVCACIHTTVSMQTSTGNLLRGIGNATAGAVFYGNAMITIISFFRLSRKWPQLVQKWWAYEIYLCRYKCPNIKRKMDAITFVILSLALCEHTLSVLSNVPDYLNKRQYVDHVMDSGNISWVGNTWRHFLFEYNMRSHHFVFDSLQYSTACGVYVFIVSKLATFAWNFLDLFLMLVAFALSHRLSYINRIMGDYNGKPTSPKQWRQVRDYYARFSILVKQVDAEVSGIVFLSFGNNLYFVCLQLLNGISPGALDPINTVYFLVSFAFLIGRTLAVTLFLARINDISRDSLTVLFSCSTDAYCDEVKRFIQQLTTDELFLTGNRFFKVTRRFTLAVAGTIATYEIILMQFNK